MAPPHAPAFDIGHPAPDRHRVSTALLWFCLLGAPLAWALQLTAIVSLAGTACVTGDGPKPTPPDPGWAAAALVPVNLVALAIAAAALAAAFVALRRTRRIKSRNPRGMMDVGEGRTRFMTVWGIFSSVLFLIAIGFNTVSAFWGGLCAG